MKNVEWGEYKLGDLFEIVGTKSLDSNAIDFTKTGINFVGRTFDNNGIQGKIKKRDFEPNKPYTIIATVIGNYKYVKFQTEPYYCSQNINKLTPKPIIKKWNERIAYFFIASVQKFVSLYDGQQGGYKLPDIKNHTIAVPIKNNEIDFNFIESYMSKLESERISEFESFLLDTGLSDYQLTEKETQALVDFENGEIELQDFTFKNIFNKIKQGRRLKKDDQLEGNIPFIMSGVTDTGVVNYISNPVASFPKNSITIDIFGNTFYRNYAYGAGDDTGVYWNDKIKYSRETMVYFASAMAKSVIGKFDYGKKLRSSQSFDFNMILPVKDGKPDYGTMERVISAIYKLVIKDVVLYVERKKKELNKLTENANA